MRYVGNTALSPQIIERIQNTFRQTVSLAQEGNRQEALLGCDFILRLDPLFEPARRLQERLNEGDGAIDVGDLLTGAEEGATEPPAAEAPAVVEEVPTIEATPTVVEEAPEIAAAELEAAAEVDPAATIPEAAPVPDDLPAHLALLYEQRSFQDLIRLAQEHQDLVAGSDEIKNLVEDATEKFEAEPYVKNFVDSAITAKDAGDLETARAHLEKAKELDPSYPDLVGLEADLSAATTTAMPPADTVEPSVPTEPAPDGEPLVDAAELIGASDLLDSFEVEIEQPVPEEAVVEVEPPADVAVDLDTFDLEVEEPTVEEPEDLELAAPEPVVEEPVVEAPETAAAEAAEPAPQPVPALDAEPSARLDSESEQRIAELLNEGQEAFEDGQYQSAIDAWSRIFLIDIDHAEASRRIELARKLKAEVERQIEETFHESISILESGKIDEAREAFQKVLEMQPNHLGAKEYLDRLDAGDLAPVGAVQPDLAPVVEPAAPQAPAVEEPEDLEPAAEEPPPESPYPEEAPAEPVVVAPKPVKAKRSFAMIGSAVLVVVLAIAWFVYSKWDRIFPASTTQPETTVVEPQVDPIERARELHEAGNTAMAINVLRRLPPGHRQYAEGQALIAMWEVGERPPEERLDEVPSEEILARRQELMDQIRSAAEQGENLLTLDLLEQAAQIGELDEEAVQFELVANEMLGPLENELDLFEQGDWDYALPSLWRKHEADPDNRDVIRLMVDCYYNLSLRDLQRGDPKSALEKLEEAGELASGDEELNRLAEFATAYTQRPSDMLYRIFVKYQYFR